MKQPLSKIDGSSGPIMNCTPAYVYVRRYSTNHCGDRANVGGTRGEDGASQDSRICRPQHCGGEGNQTATAEESVEP